ncbi:MAG: hypothetical protein JWM78_1672 [Verrucomicrobiaceae bacterium]|nr:hypothetical protein [Verrucomicrobiaceae bacterium]
MAFSLGELVFKMSADVASLRTNMSEAKDAVHEATERMAEGAEYAKKALELLGVALGTREAIEWVKSSIEMADQANKTAQKIGTTTEALTGLQYAAKLADVDNDALQTSLIKLAKNMAAAASGTGEQAQAFKTLGVSVANSDGTLRSVDSVLLGIADKFSHLQDGASKAAEAQEIFGKTGANLIPLLNQGREGINALREEAEHLGVVISTETAAAAEEFNDNLTRLKFAGAGFTNLITAEMVPALMSVTQALVEVNKDTTSAAAIGDALAVSIKALVSAGATVVTTFRDIGDALGAYAASAGSVIDGIGNTGKLIGKAATGQYEDAVTAAKNAVGDFKSAWNILDESSQHSSELIAANDDFIAQVWQKNDKVADESSKHRIESINAVAAASSAAAEQARKQFENGLMHGEGQAEQIVDRLGDKSAADFNNTTGKEATKNSLEAIGKNPEAERKALLDIYKKIEEDDENHQAALGDIEAQWAVKRRAFAEMNVKMQAKTVLSELTSLTAGMAQNNRTAFEVNKAASTATAIINTYEMATGAYNAMVNIPYVGPALAVAAAGAAIAFGMAQVSAIQSTTFSGTGGGTTPSAAGGSAVVNGTPVASSTGLSSATPQSNPSGPTINFYGDIHSNDAERLMHDIKSLINDSDFVLIDSTSRQAAELKAA